MLFFEKSASLSLIKNAWAPSTGSQAFDVLSAPDAPAPDALRFSQTVLRFSYSVRLYQSFDVLFIKLYIICIIQSSKCQDSKIMIGITIKMVKTTAVKSRMLMIITMIFQKLISYAHSFIRSMILFNGRFQWLMQKVAVKNNKGK